jgi:2-furoate---CoA ligase
MNTRSSTGIGFALLPFAAGAGALSARGKSLSCRMLDLGLSFLGSVARDPDALAIVDGEVRLTYAQWYRRMSSLAAGIDAMGLRAGDHLVTALQNRWEAATLHWVCQFAGVIITPVNWRSTASELDFYLDNADAKAIAYEDASAAAVADSAVAQKLPRIALDAARPGDIAFAALASQSAPNAAPRVNADAWSVMLYTSGTTARPKGVPRRQAAERAAAVAHVAQNLYRHGERTLGVMPLYHTMGVRSLLAMSLIGGAFICLRRFDVGAALDLIAAERVSNLYLVPTLYHDLVHHPAFAASDVSSVRKLGFAGAPMTDGLLKLLTAAFKPDLFVNHYGSSEIYTFTIDQNAPAKPGSAGRAGINQTVRVVKLGAKSVDEAAGTGEEGEIIALLAGDESFDGYWRRPDADLKALRQGWYFTGDTGFFDANGDLFVTGRVDDMIITGGENVSPVEIESCLSLHAAVSEVAVVGLPDERWGKIIAAFIKPRAAIAAEELDAFCRKSGLAGFKRPRRYVFVKDIPKSPVGKLLRRKLVAGDYQPAAPVASKPVQGTPV